MKWKFPISPVAASRPRVSKWGAYFTGTYKDFRLAAKPVVENTIGDWQPTESQLYVYVGLYPTKPKTSKLLYPRPDIDNYVKSILDLCNGVVWNDDAQIIFLEAHKEWAKKDGYFTLEIKEMSDE
jgi:Holliday junction resolvase RusA-like endonuclease